MCNQNQIIFKIGLTLSLTVIYRSYFTIRHRIMKYLLIRDQNQNKSSRLPTKIPWSSPDFMMKSFHWILPAEIRKIIPSLALLSFPQWRPGIFSPSMVDTGERWAGVTTLFVRNVWWLAATCRAWLWCNWWRRGWYQDCLGNCFGLH